MPKVIKPSNPFTNVCWVSVLTTFSAPQILAASTVFFCLFRNEETKWVIVSFGAANLVCFEPVNVVTSCNKQGLAVTKCIFHGVIPDAF